MTELAGVVEFESVKETLASGRTCEHCDEHAQQAKLIQSSLLPITGFCHESVEIVFRFMPFSEVGGDFLDFFCLPDGCIGIYLGDVVGKGLSAAMFAALVMGSLRGIHKTGTDTARVLSLLNERMLQRPILGRFCSTLYAIYNSSHSRTHLLQCRDAAATACFGKHISAARRRRIAVGIVSGRHVRKARCATQPGRLRFVRNRWTSRIAESRWNRILHLPNRRGLGTMPAPVSDRIGGLHLRSPGSIRRWQRAARRYYGGRAESVALAHGHQRISARSIRSSMNFLPASSLPVRSNEFVIAAAPFSTLVIT